MRITAEQGLKSVSERITSQRFNYGKNGDEYGAGAGDIIGQKLHPIPAPATFTLSSRWNGEAPDDMFIINAGAAIRRNSVTGIAIPFAAR